MHLSDAKQKSYKTNPLYNFHNVKHFVGLKQIQCIKTPFHLDFFPKFSGDKICLTKTNFRKIHCM